MPELHPLQDSQAVRDKKRVAFSSVIAAVALTVMKVVVGIWTGSLGMLSEAAHSGLDLVAAVVTYFAVRFSSRPADREHTYGHGKVENLSALFETLLLLLTCVWIFYEAVERLFVKEVEVDASGWAFAVMGVSIVVNFSRARALRRVALKYDSQALAADALHFQTDIWSSWVVVGGLALVWLGGSLGQPWLAKADPVAAVGVGLIVVWVSYRLGRKTIADLLDEVPPGVRDEVLKVLHLPGVLKVDRVRVRKSGPEAFVDVTLCVARDTSLEQGHAIADAAERAVRGVLPGADVVVHVEPATDGARCDEASLHGLVRQVAARLGLGAHDIRVHDVMGERSLEVHVEVGEAHTVASAHELVTEFERSIRSAHQGLDRIVTHIEPAIGAERDIQPASPGEAELIAQVERIAAAQSVRCQPHDILVHRQGSSLHLSLHCVLEAELAIAEAHAFTERLERALIEGIPGLSRAVIHVEPPDARTGPPDA